MSDSTLEEFLTIVQRDLAADAVRVVDTTAEPPPNETSLRCDLPGGRRLIATFATLPSDMEVRRRRLEMLVTAFVDLLSTEGRPRSSRLTSSLQEELAALAQRASALDALVIDAHSPVLWGSASEPMELALRPLPGLQEFEFDTVRSDPAAEDQGAVSAKGLRIDLETLALLPRAVCIHHRLMPIAQRGTTLLVAIADPTDAEAIHDVVLLTGLEVEPIVAPEMTVPLVRHVDNDSDLQSYEEAMAAIPPEIRAARQLAAQRARDSWKRSVLSRRALDAVRALPETMALHRGGQLRHSVSESDFGYIARSFAAIYVVILVFPGPFEELLARRALAHALPAIERLVAALPPLEPPPPTAGVAAMRVRRQR